MDGSNKQNTHICNEYESVGGVGAEAIRQNVHTGGSNEGSGIRPHIARRERRGAEQGSGKGRRDRTLICVIQTTAREFNSAG